MTQHALTPVSESLTAINSSAALDVQAKMAAGNAG